MRALPLLASLLAVAVVALLAAACGEPAADDVSEATDNASTSADDAEPPAGGLTIVATTSILGDVVGRIVGVDGTVDVLLPRGADPHDFALSASQAQSLREADLVVANGLSLEEGMIDALESAEADGATIIEAAAAIDPIEFGAVGGHGDHDAEDHGDEDHGDEGEHGHEGDDDPHFWMDPARLGLAAVSIGQALADVDQTLDDAVWADRAQAVADDLEGLDAEVTEILSVIPDDQRVMVTNHEAFGYFADAYDFEIIGTIIPGGATLAEPSAADLEELVEIIEAEGVSAVFAESTDPSALAEVVADEAGADVTVAVLFSGSLSDEDGPASTYRDYMIFNATTIAEALTG